MSGPKHERPPFSVNDQGIVAPIPKPPFDRKGNIAYFRGRHPTTIEAIRQALSDPTITDVQVLPSREHHLSPTARQEIAESGRGLIIKADVKGPEGKMPPDFEGKQDLFLKARKDPLNRRDLHAMKLNEAPELVVAQMYYIEGKTIRQIAEEQGRQYASVNRDLREFDVWMGAERNVDSEPHIKKNTLSTRNRLRDEDLAAPSRDALREQYTVDDQMPPEFLQLKSWHIWAQLAHIRANNPKLFASLPVQDQLVVIHAFHMDEEARDSGPDTSRDVFAAWLGFSKSKYENILTRSLYELGIKMR